MEDYLMMMQFVVMQEFEMYQEAIKIYYEHEKPYLDCDIPEIWKRRMRYYKERGEFPIIGNEDDIFLMGAMTGLLMLESMQGINHDVIDKMKNESNKQMGIISYLDLVDELIKEWKKLCPPKVLRNPRRRK